jgi:hypothetical protein
MPTGSTAAPSLDDYLVELRAAFGVVRQEKSGPSLTKAVH